MIAIINFIVMVVAGALMTIFYLMSVRPAALEQKIGERAYKRSATYRMIGGGIFIFVVMANYIIYYFYPLPIPLARTFPWPHWISAIIAVLIAVPGLTLMIVSGRATGEEAMIPKKEHTMYGGIYQKIRHPMAVGELPLWFAIAFAEHSPFLMIFSLVWIPVWYWWCVAEEKDLLLRYGESYAEYCRQVPRFIPRRQQKA